MTLSTTSSRVRYQGDGLTESFPVPFKFFDPDHIRVVRRDSADRETLWVRGTQYRLSGAGSDSGGTLTVVTEPEDHRPQPGDSLVISLEVPLTQEKSFPLGGAFPSTQAEEGLDLAVQRDSQLAAFNRRVLSVPTTDARVGGLELPIDTRRAGKYLGFDALGKPTVFADSAGPADLSDKTVRPSGAVEARRLSELFGFGALAFENVRLHGAKGDAAELTDGRIDKGANRLFSDSAAFTAADVGKVIAVEGAATSGVAIAGASAAPVDAAWAFDASTGSFANLTADLRDSGANDGAPFPSAAAPGDLFYLGHAERFSGLAFTLGTAGVGGALAWEYWDGTGWRALSASDGTSGFTAAPGRRDLSFTPPGDWQPIQINRPINGEKLFYLRARLTATYTTAPILSRAVPLGGRIRIAAPNHGFNPGQVVSLEGIAGTAEANGTFETVRAGLNAFDLKGSSFQNDYLSGGAAHGWLIATIVGVSGGAAILATQAGASVQGARFLYGTDDTAALQSAIDTGRAVVLPEGRYFSATLKVTTEGQQIIGLGGRLWVTPGRQATAAGLLRLQADFTLAKGLYLDNPTEQLGPRPGATAHNTGIRVEANKVRVDGNIVRRFLNGIVVTDRPGDSFEPGAERELHGTVIQGNVVWENLGAGSGDDQGGNLGEDRGDGIVSWGAATVISGNIVHVKAGYDARIGIHVEGLNSSHDGRYPYADQGASIVGNQVLGNGIESRNGRWRRGITIEGVKDSVISNNFVSGIVWWGLAGIFGGGGGGLSVSGNTVFFDRPGVDLSGENYSPINAAIMIYASSPGGLNGASIYGNSIRIFGRAERGITTDSNGSSRRISNISIVGNSINNIGGEVGNYMNMFRVSGFVVDGNVMDGGTVGIGFRSASADRQTFNNNQLFMDRTSVRAVEINDSSVDGFVLCRGNYVVGGFVGINVFFADHVVVDGNVVSGTASHSIDMFSSSSGVVANNVLLKPDGQVGSINNWIAGPSKIRDNNLLL